MLDSHPYFQPSEAAKLYMQHMAGLLTPMPSNTVLVAIRVSAIVWQKLFDCYYGTSKVERPLSTYMTFLGVPIQKDGELSNDSIVLDYIEPKTVAWKG